MPETALPATDLDLISFLKEIANPRMRRGIRIPGWYLLLLAVQGGPEPLPEPAGSGAFCYPPPQRVERGTGHRTQPSTLRFSLPLLLPPVGRGGPLRRDSRLDDGPDP